MVTAAPLSPDQTHSGRVTRGREAAAAQLVPSLTKTSRQRLRSGVTLKSHSVLLLSCRYLFHPSFSLQQLPTIFGLQLRHKCLLLRIIQQETIISIAIESKYS